MPDYPALAAELAGPAYQGKTDAEAAALLNGADSPLVRARSVVPAHLVFEAIAPADWTALNATEKQRVQTLLGMGQVDLSGANTRASLGAAFGPATATRAALVALQTETVARTKAVEVFGSAVHAGDVAAARRLQQGGA